MTINDLMALEAWAVNATAFWATNLVNQRELERAIAVGGREQARSVDIVAETDVELLVVEAGAHDNGVHQFLVVEFVGETCPQTKLEGLVVATAVAEQELEGVTHVHLPRWTLEESHHTWAEAELLRWHKLTTCVEGEFAVERNILVLERLVGAVQVAECTTEVEVSVLVEHAEPQHTCRKVGEEETWVSDYFAIELAIETTIAIVLARPLQVVAFDATVAQTDVGTEYKVVRFFAVSTHFLGVRARKTGLDGGKFGSTGFVAPKCAAYAKIIVATHRQFLIVRSRIGVVGAIFQDRSPLVAVVGDQAVVAVHHTRHGRVEVERTLVELRKVDVLGLSHCPEHHETQ